MIRLTILLTLTTIFVQGQTPVDSEVYSIVIDDLTEQWNKGRDTIKRAIVIQKFTPLENHVSWYGKELFALSDEIINMTVHYDTLAMRLIRTEQIKNGLINLETVFYDTPTLNDKEFKSKTPVTTISDKKYHAYFKTLFGRDIDKGWKRFYKQNRDVLGVYEFSKIVYADNYAILYVGHHGGGLFGSGDIVILNKVNDKWIIVKYLNIWMS